MYSDFDLGSPWRRVINFILLEALSLQVRIEFNASFDTAYKLKASTVDKISEHNSRLKEITAELRHMGVHLKPDDERPLEPLTHPDESPEHTFVVTDEEVAVEKYVSSAEKERLASEQAEEGKRNAGGAKSGSFDRALKQMMNGQLSSKDAGQVVWVLEKPAWMQGDASKWSDDQKRLFQLFVAEQKRLDEEQEKRRQALEGEV